MLRELRELIDSLELLGVEGLITSVEAIERTYKEERAPKPKKVATKKPAAKGLRVLSTTGGVALEIYFDTEAKAEAWMKIFQKNKAQQVEAYLKNKGLQKPAIASYSDEGREKYKREVDHYLQRLESAGLDTRVLIERVC